MRAAPAPTPQTEQIAQAGNTQTIDAKNAQAAQPSNSAATPQTEQTGQTGGTATTEEQNAQAAEQSNAAIASSAAEQVMENIANDNAVNEANLAEQERQTAEDQMFAAEQEQLAKEAVDAGNAANAANAVQRGAQDSQGGEEVGSGAGGENVDELAFQNAGAQIEETSIADVLDDANAANVAADSGVRGAGGETEEPAIENEGGQVEEMGTTIVA